MTGIKPKRIVGDPSLTEILLNVYNTAKVTKYILDTLVNQKNRFNGKNVKKLYLAVYIQFKQNILLDVFSNTSKTLIPWALLLVWSHSSAKDFTQQARFANRRD